MVETPDISDSQAQLQDDRYRLEEVIGAGSAAIVWLARDEQTGQSVAIKWMREDTMDLEDIQRLAQEVEILKRLNHPCIVKLVDTGVAADGCPYVVMEWVEGITLRDMLEQSPVIPPDDVADILNQICSALAEAHEHGVVHRDIKPENVLLCAPEHLAVKVVDFGMAKLVSDGAPSLTVDDKIFGTPEYMSPERAIGREVDSATDIYGVAIVAYEMLMGRRPFDGINPIQTMTRQVQSPPPPMEGIPARISAAVLDGLAKEPRERPTARRFALALSRAVDAS